MAEVDLRTRDLLLRIAAIGRELPRSAVEDAARWLETFGSAAEVRGVPPVARASAREELLAIVQEWGATHGHESMGSLGWALRGAHAMDDWWRADRLLELVWTGPAPPTGTLRQTGQALQEVVRAARHELWLVTYAGYKLPELGKEVEAVLERGVDVKLVVEDDTKGKISVGALEALGDWVVRTEAYVWPRDKRLHDGDGGYGSLHVKCALADDRVLFVSSANLTGYAMELNMEMGLLVTGGETPKLARRHLAWLVSQRILKKVAPDLD